MDFETDYKVFRKALYEFLQTDERTGYNLPLDEFVSELPFDRNENCVLFHWIAKVIYDIDCIANPKGSLLSVDYILNKIDKISEIVKEKNNDYGNSALTAPILTPNTSATTAILCRMSDKVQRYMNLVGKNTIQQISETLAETLSDFIGYAILLWIYTFVCGDNEKEVYDCEKPILFVPKGMTVSQIVESVQTMNIHLEQVD